MPKQYRLNGTVYNVPDDATEQEALDFVDAHSKPDPNAAVKTAQAQKYPTQVEQDGGQLEGSSLLASRQAASADTFKKAQPDTAGWWPNVRDSILGVTDALGFGTSPSENLLNTFHLGAAMAGAPQGAVIPPVPDQTKDPEGFAQWQREFGSGINWHLPESWGDIKTGYQQNEPSTFMHGVTGLATELYPAYKMGEAGLGMAKEGVANWSAKTGKRIETTAVKPTSPTLGEVHAPDGQQPVDALVENIFKNKLGGNLQQSWTKTQSLIKELTGQLQSVLKQEPSQTVDLNLALAKVRNYFNSPDVAARQGSSMPDIQKALDNWQNAIEVLNKSGAAQGGSADLYHSNLFKQDVGDDGNWTFGQNTPELKGRTIVSNALYSEVKRSIEQSAGQSGPTVKAINDRLSQVLPVNDALLRRIPVAMRNEIWGLKESVGLALGNKAGLGMGLLSRTLKSPTVANWLMKLSAGLGGPVQPNDPIQLSRQTEQGGIAFAHAGEISGPPNVASEPLAVNRQITRNADGSITYGGQTYTGPNVNKDTVYPSAPDTSKRDPITGELLMPAQPLPDVSLNGAKAALPAAGVSGFPDTMSAQDRASVPGQTPGSVNGPSAQTDLGTGPYRRSGAPAQAVTTPPGQASPEVVALQGHVTQLQREADLAEASGNNVESQTKRAQAEQIQAQIQQQMQGSPAPGQDYSVAGQGVGPAGETAGQTPGLTQTPPAQPPAPTPGPMANWSFHDVPSVQDQVSGAPLEQNQLPMGQATVREVPQGQVSAPAPQGALPAGPQPQQLPAPTEPATAPPRVRNVQGEDFTMRPEQPPTTGEATVTPTATKLPRVPQNQDLINIANEYNRKRGASPLDLAPKAVNESKSQAIADFYDANESKPNNPAVQRAYAAMNKEVEAQYNALVKAGYNFEPTDTPPTYKNQNEVSEDLANNKHLFVWTGEPPAHGLMSPEQNFKFRAVHDAFEHGAAGNTQGHFGEEQTYHIGKQMFSPEAQKAFATETRGQNATVHFSSELKNPPNTIYDEQPTGLKFPDQKAMILPSKLRQRVATDPGEALKNAGYREMAADEIKREQLLDQKTKKAFFITDDGRIFRVEEHSQALKRSGLVTPTDGMDALDIREKGLQDHGLMRVQAIKGQLELESHGKPSTAQMDTLADLDMTAPDGLKYEYDFRDQNGRPVAASSGRSSYIDMFDDVDNSYNSQRGLAAKAFRREGSQSSETQTSFAYSTSRGRPTMTLSNADLKALQDNGFLKTADGGSWRNMVPGDIPELDALAKKDPRLQPFVDGMKRAINEGQGRPVNVSTGVPDALDHELLHSALDDVGLNYDQINIPSKFRNQVRYLAEHGYDVSKPDVLVHELLAHAGSDDPNGFGSTDVNRELANHILKEVSRQIGPEGVQELLDRLSPDVQGEANNELKFQANEPYTDATRRSQEESGNHQGLTPEDYRDLASRIPDDGAEPISSFIDRAFERRTGRVEQHLLPEEVANRRKDFLERLRDRFNISTSVSDIEGLAKAGAVGRYWYENSAKAIQNYFGSDGPLFARLLAAMSPLNPVRDNAIQAIHAFDAWDAAGRPTDPEQIRPILNSTPGSGGDKFPAHFNNAMRVLTGEDDPLSGPKVRSFYRNLINESDYVTLDGWMAKMSGLKDKVISDSGSGYLAFSAKIRAAAKNLGWTPMQVQAASWSFLRPVWDMIANGTPAREALRGVSLDVQKDASDFAKIFAEDPDVRQKLDSILKRSGKSLRDVEAAADKPVYGREEEPRARFSRQFSRGLQDRANPVPF